MTHAKKEAEKMFGTDINSFGQQRDGFIKGFDKGREIGIIQGICIALRNHIVGYKPETWIAENLTIKICEEAKVDEFDLGLIREYFKPMMEEPFTKELGEGWTSKIGI